MTIARPHVPAISEETGFDWSLARVLRAVSPHEATLAIGLPGQSRGCNFWAIDEAEADCPILICPFPVYA